MKTDPTFWILARSSGLLAYALLTSSVLAGLVLKARPFGTALKAATVTDIHRFLAMLGLGAVVAHASALVLDSTVHVGIGSLLVPGLAPYRPLWTGLGVLAAELMVVVYASFSLRKRIGTQAPYSFQSRYTTTGRSRCGTRLSPFVGGTSARHAVAATTAPTAPP